MKIQRMKTNRIVNPLGFDLKTPHVSWTVTDTEAKKQLWARVEVSKTEDFADIIFDTGACKTASSLGVPVEIALEPRTRYFWRVTVMGDNGELVTSDTAWFETAKLDEPFTAQRISPCLAPDTAPYMRRAFEITGEVLSARAYFTGLGIYELYLNGEKANDEYLAPGCTAYDSWIQYQTYDVTDLVHTGENVIGAILGNGWAKGRFGFDGVVFDFRRDDAVGQAGIVHVFVAAFDIIGEVFADIAVEQCAQDELLEVPSVDGSAYFVGYFPDLCLQFVSLLYACHAFLFIDARGVVHWVRVIGSC